MSILELAEQFGKEEYAKHDEFHQWKHAEDVMGIALKLASFHPEVDLEILKLAVIFHDISYEEYETHVDESVKTAEKFLREHGYPENRLNKVLEVMISHSGPHRRRLGEAQTIEGKIIYDSDKFYLAQTPEGFEKYYPQFYLEETRGLFKQSCPRYFK
jgi:uncharacterized protein